MTTQCNTLMHTVPQYLLPGFLNTSMVFFLDFLYVLKETLSLLGYLHLEKSKHKVGEGGRVEDLEFPGVLKKYHVEILRVN